MLRLKNRRPDRAQYGRGKHKWFAATAQKNTGSHPSAAYRPRKPQSSAYYQCVEAHFEVFEQVYEDRFVRRYGFFRPYVSRVIQRYLDCGVLHNGFARVRCGDCGHEYLLAFLQTSPYRHSASGSETYGSERDFLEFHHHLHIGLIADSLTAQYVVTHPQPSHNLNFLLDSLSKRYHHP